MLDNYLEVDGKKLEVLFLFNYKERDFVVYECPDGEISASLIKNNEGQITLEKITENEANKTTNRTNISSSSITLRELLYNKKQIKLQTSWSEERKPRIKRKYM